MSKMHDAALLAAVLMECRKPMDGRGDNDILTPPHTVADDATALIRIGGRIARRAVRACNGEGARCYDAKTRRMEWTWTDDDDAARDRADARDRAKAEDIAARYGAAVITGGDPRGYTLRLRLPSGRSNSMDRDTWGVA